MKISLFLNCGKIPHSNFICLFIHLFLTPHMVQFSGSFENDTIQQRQYSRKTSAIPFRASYGSAIDLNMGSSQESMLKPKLTKKPQLKTPSGITSTITEAATRTNTPNYSHDNKERNNSLDYPIATGPLPTIYRRTDSSGIHGDYSYDIEVNERINVHGVCFCVLLCLFFCV